MPRLILMMRASTPKQVSLKDGRTTIGRGPSNSLVVDSPLVSRAHVALDTEGEAAILTDLGSSNGTLVNGRRIERQVLKHRDVVEIGDCQLRFLVVSDTMLPVDSLSLENDTAQGLLATRSASLSRTTILPHSD